MHRLIRFSSLCLAVFLGFFSLHEARALDLTSDALTFNAHGLALLNTIQQDNQESDDPSRTQFDGAVNLDGSYQLSPRTWVGMQLQSGPGGGSLGLQGPATIVTDLYLAHRLENEQVTFTLGSFDLPFGYGARELTNNGDTSANRLLLNPLLYSVVGDPMASHNTIGGKVDYVADQVEATLALSNGTSETASNSDGSFAATVGFGLRDLIPDTRFGVWLLRSDDNTDAGSEGLGTILTGVLLDLRTTLGSSLLFAGHVGMMRFDDDVSDSEDDITVWMGELGYDLDDWRFTGRASGWMAPENDTTPNVTLPNPGLAVPAGGVVPRTDQGVIRFQLGVQRMLNDNMSLKLEAIRDQYQQQTLDEDTNVNAVLLGLNIHI